MIKSYSALENNNRHSRISSKRDRKRINSHLNTKNILEITEKIYGMDINSITTDLNYRYLQQNN